MMKLIRRITTFALVLGLASACQPIGNSTFPIEVRVPNDAPFVLKGISNLTKVSQLTGYESPNDTSRYDVYGTDLGSMINFKGKTYFVFGDTFGYRPPDQIGAGGADWRSNVIGISSDSDPSDGLTIDQMIADYGDHAMEVIPSLKIDDEEMTTIPTHGIAVGENLYLYFMSVKHWGAPGEWETNYAGVSRSTDGGEHWEILEDLKWPGESNFIQVSPYSVKVNDNMSEIYFWCIPSGRFGDVKLMKVNEKNIEDWSAYRYYAGLDNNGDPIWSESMDNAMFVVEDNFSVGELSVVWNPYLERWIMTYLKEGTGIVIREGIKPWGPWSPAITLVDKDEYPGLYAPYMNPKFTEDGAKTIYFTLSLWGPYNVFWMKATLEK